MNETIKVEEFFTSNIGVLKLGSGWKIVVSTVLIIFTLFGLSIKVLFLYYLQYKAPKKRPINTLMWFDQVRYIK